MSLIAATLRGALSRCKGVRKIARIAIAPRLRFTSAMRNFLHLLVACAVFTAATVYGQGPEAKKELLKIEQDYAKALSSNDTKAILAGLAEEWKLVMTNGEVVTRKDLVEALESGKLKFDAYSSADLDVRIFGETAVVIGSGTSKGSWDGHDFTGADRFTDVFVRRDGKWTCVSSHSTELKD
jgi:ketosteroid isomerase-like protein